MDRLGDCLWGVLGGVVDTIHWLSDFLLCYFQIGFQYFATMDTLEKDLELLYYDIVCNDNDAIV